MSRKASSSPSPAASASPKAGDAPSPTRRRKVPGKAAPSAARRRKASGKAVPSAARRRKGLRGVPGTFGDLCEVSGGLAAAWRRGGCTEREMWAFAEDDPAILCDVVPALHALGFGEEDVLRHVPHDGPLAGLLLGLSRLLTLHPSWGGGEGSDVLALPPLVAVALLRRALSRRIAALRNRAARPLHYEAEKARRRAMAAERRRVRRRATASPCPTREALLEAWRRVRESKGSLVRFGSLVQDLECYVDSSLRMDGAGRIVGRNAGIKGWLRENLPELAGHYSMVMRYKAAAKKLGQIVGLADPTPVAAVLAGEAAAGEGAAGGTAEGSKGEGDSCNHGAEKSHGGGGKCGAGTPPVGVARNGTPPVEVVRARAVYLEAMEGVPDVAARVMARIDALCDPERLDEAATLRGWREKYAREITVRRREAWWRRLTA